MNHTLAIAVAAAAAISLASAHNVRADQAAFDFEAATPGQHASLSLTNNGLTIDIRRGSFLPMQVLDTTGYPPSWGHRAAAPFSISSADLFYMNFSSPLTAFSMESGDFQTTGAGEPDFMTLTAFSGPDGTGSQLGIATFDYDGAHFFPAVALLSLNAPVGQTIGSVTFGSVDQWGSVSVLFDNIHATFVPSMGVATIAPLNFSTLFARRRR